MSASNLTEKDTGFFILMPPDSGVTEELLQDITVVKEDPSIHIFLSDWLVYTPSGDEHGYCFAIPGIKLYFKNETDFGKIKILANQILNELNNKTNLNLDLVYINKTELIEHANRGG